MVLTSSGRRAALGADHVHRLDCQLVDDLRRVFNQQLSCKGGIAGHRARAAESELVEADHAIVPAQMRNPRAPGFRALGEPMNHDDRFRMRPRIGPVVDLIVELEI